MCGILGIIDKSPKKNVGYDIFQGLLMLQHRGQDAAGIITYDHMFHLKKGLGLVLNVFNVKNLARLKGNMGIGQVRYPTIGRGSPEDAQPFYINHPFGIAMVHNGNVTNFYSLKEELYKKNQRHINSTSDVEVILNVFAEGMEDKEFSFDTLKRGVLEVMKRVQGAYSVIALIAEKGLVAWRDPLGIRPLVMGKTNNSIAFSSETVAFDFLGFEIIRDVRPGEIVWVKKNLEIVSEVLISKTPKHCIFEWVYFARPDSIIEGIGILEARKRLGRFLAEKCKKKGIKPDVIIAIPDTARPAAIPLAKELGVELSEGLIRNRYIARTFIMPSDSLRRTSVKQKLNPVVTELKGKKVMLVDDSIVRGNTSREIIKMVRNAGAKEVYYAVYSSPLRYPCVYGIDMATRDEFIAGHYTEEEIKEKIGADELVYQDLEMMVKAVKKDRNIDFCTACFSGKYPTRVSEKDLLIIEKERKESKKES